jgi:type VI secretion system protein ImpC
MADETQQPDQPVQPEQAEPKQQPKTKSASPASVSKTAVLDKIIEATNRVRFKRDGEGNIDQGTKDLIARSEQMLVAFGDALTDPRNDRFKNAVVQDDPTKVNLIDAIEDRIADIDEQLSTKLNAILHSAEFQKLEATWRGLHYLVQNTETGDRIKLRVLNVKQEELVKDIEKATEFDQSALFKKIYEDEYGTYGGFPYSCLVGDYYFTASAVDLVLLKGLAGVAAAAHAPFITAPSPALFGWESFNEMNNRRDLAKGFSATELAPWNSFRESEDSRYVAMVLPRILLRNPYDDKPVEQFKFNELRVKYLTGKDNRPIDKDGNFLSRDQPRVFQEDVDHKDSRNYLWGSAAYALAARITDAFAKYGWCAAIRGVEGGGKVEELPFHTFHTDDGDVVLKCPTEISITDRREKELSDLGFISLCHCKGKDYAAFFGGQTVNKPKEYLTNEATANARLSSSLPYVLAASRFAHYLKVIMRDKIGSFMTAGNVSTFLNQWIAQWVLLDDDAPQGIKARFPLREARVDVIEQPGKPGCYNSVVFLKPHFQLDELTVSIRLVAELPAPAK